MTLEHTTNRIFDALSAHVQSDKRCLVAIAGPPAVGKSTLAECLCDKLNQAKKKVGVLEVILLTLLRDSAGDSVLASVLIFRLLYFVLPLFFGMLVLVGHEIYGGAVEARLAREEE